EVGEGSSRLGDDDGAVGVEVGVADGGVERQVGRAPDDEDRATPGRGCRGGGEGSCVDHRHGAARTVEIGERETGGDLGLLAGEDWRGAEERGGGEGVDAEEGGGGV